MNVRRRKGRQPRRRAAAVASAKGDAMTTMVATERAPAAVNVREPVIELVGVEKSYRMGRLDYPALRGVDLEIGAGELVAIVGPSGSGKTTILNLVSGIDRPTSGSVTVDGLRIDSMGEEELAVWRGEHVGRRVPVLPAAADVVGAGERGAAARLRAPRLEAGAVRAGSPQPRPRRARRQGRPSPGGAVGW